MYPSINRSPLCLRSKAVIKLATRNVTCFQHNNHSYYYYDLIWMRYHQGLNPAGRGHYLILTLLPWILLDIFNIDPGPCKPTTGGTPPTGTQPKSRARIRLPKIFYDPMNDSPGLFLFGLDSTSWSSVSGFFILLLFPLLQNFLFHLQNTF